MRRGYHPSMSNRSHPNSGSTGVRGPSDSADAAARILDQIGAQWAFIGAIAAMRYRTSPRMTVDVDDLILDGEHPLDESYIEHWSATWDVEDRWREARESR